MSDEDDASPAILVAELAGPPSTRSVAAPAISSDSYPLLVPRVGLGLEELDDGLAILVLELIGPFSTPSSNLLAIRAGAAIPSLGWSVAYSGFVRGDSPTARSFASSCFHVLFNNRSSIMFKNVSTEGSFHYTRCSSNIDIVAPTKSVC